MRSRSTLALVGALLLGPALGCATTPPVRLERLPRPVLDTEMDAQLPSMLAQFQANHPELEVRSFGPRHEAWSLQRDSSTGKPRRRTAYLNVGVLDGRTQRCFYLVPVFSQRMDEASGEWDALELREHMELEYAVVPERRLDARRTLVTERVDGVSASPLECNELPARAIKP